MTATAARVGRFYTSARRHPWVLGKVADWHIPLGPYTPAQITVAVGGGFLLVKTISWWSWLGPLPLVGWALVIWAVRRPTIRGRAPMQAAFGWALLAWQPKGGRIGGHAARDPAPRPLVGGFTLEDAPAAHPAAMASPSRAARRHGPPSPRPQPIAAGRASAPQPADPALPGGPVSGVQQLLALLQQDGGAR
ncbi:hypothetical protein ACF08B_39450 [Streptomyces sp. NPDC015139]|uniref:hypothetical protein n=1 Tax=Streptomyces sp. NPDC015139 TaxID=3364942 RepID=UPI0036FDA131